MKKKLLTYALCLSVAFSAGALTVACKTKGADTDKENDYYQAYGLYVAYAQENGQAADHS